jgi:hypothetical protein
MIAPTVLVAAPCFDIWQLHHGQADDARYFRSASAIDSRVTPLGRIKDGNP